MGIHDIYYCDLPQWPPGFWLRRESGILIPRDMQPFLFRGECGNFPTTTNSAGRAASYLHSGGKGLSVDDQNLLRKLIPIVANRFVAADYELDEHAAWGLLQHYGMPTPMTMPREPLLAQIVPGHTQKLFTERRLPRVPMPVLHQQKSQSILSSGPCRHYGFGTGPCAVSARCGWSDSGLV
jgi:hypothetical protein